MGLTWSDTEEVALKLLELHPETEPLQVRFTQLYQWVVSLEGFTGERGGNKEKALEAIQMAWYEEKNDQ